MSSASAARRAAFSAPVIVTSGIAERLVALRGQRGPAPRTRGRDLGRGRRRRRQLGPDTGHPGLGLLVARADERASSATPSRIRYRRYRAIGSRARQRRPLVASVLRRVVGRRVRPDPVHIIASISVGPSPRRARSSASRVAPYTARRRRCRPRARRGSRSRRRGPRSGPRLLVRRPRSPSRCSDRAARAGRGAPRPGSRPHGSRPRMPSRPRSTPASTRRTRRASRRAPTHRVHDLRRHRLRIGLRARVVRPAVPGPAVVLQVLDDVDAAHDRRRGSRNDGNTISAARTRSPTWAASWPSNGRYTVSSPWRWSAMHSRSSRRAEHHEAQQLPQVLSGQADVGVPDRRAVGGHESQRREAVVGRVERAHRGGGAKWPSIYTPAPWSPRRSCACTSRSARSPPSRRDGSYILGGGMVRPPRRVYRQRTTHRGLGSSSRRPARARW